MRAGRIAVAIVGAVLLGACAPRGGDSATLRRAELDDLVARGELDAAVEQLRFAIASNPADVRAHRDLARLEVRREFPGAALRHFEIVRRNGGLGREDRQALARLYVERARERISLGDGEAYRDLETARRLDGKAEEARLLAEAYLLGALAELRRGKGTEAAKLGRKAHEHAPADSRTAFLDPDGAPLEELGAAATWAFDGGAKRAARKLLDRYVERGGRNREVLRRFLAAREWWGGKGARPDLLVLDQVAAAGVSLCPVASEPLELGCARSLSSTVGTPEVAEVVRRRADRLYWRFERADAAGAWVVIALRAWLDGRVDAWFGELGRRVDIAALLARYRPDELPVFAAATLLRAGGRSEDAGVALDRAIAAAAELRPPERVVVLAEAAMQGRSVETMDRLLASGPVDAMAWDIAVRDARARATTSPKQGRARLARLLGVAPAPEVLRRFLRRAGELGVLVERSAPEAVTADRYALARWSKALAGSHLAEGRRAVVKRWRDLLGDADRLPGADEVEVAPFGVPDPMVARGLAALEPEAAVGLVAVANAYVGDPAVADRLAEELVDGAVSVTRRGPAVASLFAQLGDPVRALDWWEKIADASPEHPAYLLGLADAVAATGDAPRAQIHFIAAAANSGDPGAMSLLAARSLARHGADVEALSACRRALQLTAPGDEQEVLSTIARIDDELGRAAAASAAREALVEQTPERFRDAARGTWRSLRDRLLDAPADALVVAAADPSDAALALARARALRAAGDDTGACAAIERARAWNPGQVSLGVYRLRNCASDPAELAEAAAELLAVYVAGQGGLSSREHALRALAEAFDALGEAAAAAAARAELAGLERSAFPTWPISPADAYLR